MLCSLILFIRESEMDKYKVVYLVNGDECDATFSSHNESVSFMVYLIKSGFVITDYKIV